MDMDALTIKAPEADGTPIIVTDFFGRKWRFIAPPFFNPMSWGTWFPWYQLK